jgi:hypothetical protein
VASVTGTGVCDQKSVYTRVAEYHPNAAVIVPPRTLEAVMDLGVSNPHVLSYGNCSQILPV